MKEQRLILDLLYWIEELGLRPKRLRSDDRFIEPITKRIYRGSQLLPHQKNIALWLPEEEALADLLRERGLGSVETTSKDGVYFASLQGDRRLEGIGVGPTEALLSVLQALRCSRNALQQTA